MIATIIVAVMVLPKELIYFGETVKALKILIIG